MPQLDLFFLPTCALLLMGVALFLVPVLCESFLLALLGYRGRRLLKPAAVGISPSRLPLRQLSPRTQRSLWRSSLSTEDGDALTF